MWHLHRHLHLHRPLHRHLHRHRGYDQKDKGKAHYLHVSMGFTELELQQALNVYRAKAAQNAYSGSEKMHKNPASNKTQVDFKVGNAHVLAVWFVAHHGLQALTRWLTLSTVIGLAIQTGNYRLDESLLTGKNGGEPLDATRSDAYFALSVLQFEGCADLCDLVPCIETVLHGAAREHSQTNGYDGGMGGLVIPSTPANDSALRTSISLIRP